MVDFILKQKVQYESLHFTKLLTRLNRTFLQILELRTASFFRTKATLAKNRNKIERMTQKAFQWKWYPADRQLFETWKSSQQVLFTCFEIKLSGIWFISYEYGKVGNLHIDMHISTAHLSVVQILNAQDPWFTLQYSACNKFGL